MREPLTKFPKRPGGPEQARRALEECQRMLANPRLSPEMRSGLKQRVAQLRAEIEAARHGRSADPAAGETSGPPRSPRQ